MRQTFILLVAALLLSACRIAINTDEYEFLTREEKALIQPYPGLAEIGPKTDSKPRFYSVQTGEVQEMIRAHPYTLLFTPGCNPEKIPANMELFNNFSLEAEAMNIYPLCLSLGFPLNEYISWIQTTKYDYPVFFHSSEEFGIKLKAKYEGLRAAVVPERKYLRSFTVFNQAGEVVYTPLPWDFSVDSMDLAMEQAELQAERFSE